MRRLPKCGICVATLAFVLLIIAGVASAQAYVEAERQPNEVSNQMLVSTEWLTEHLNDADVVVLCIARDPAFYSRGHIPGARLLPLEQIVISGPGVPNQLPSIEQLKKAFESAGVTDLTRIILYGERSGLMAARGYWTLDYLGVADHAALLDGGLEKWQAEGRSLSQETPQTVAGHITVQENPGVLVSAAELETMLRKGLDSITLLDARPANEFSGAKLSEEAPKAGHIPGAKSLYWMRTLESAQNPILRRESELREIFQELGASANDPVITYCRSGMQSSFDYFVAKYLGYKARMYGGSFLDWSKRGFPVEGTHGKPAETAPR
jgi:thiosulfate/3-mercaptopyruvate sulfurtransferase